MSIEKSRERAQTSIHALGFALRSGAPPASAGHNGTPVRQPGPCIPKGSLSPVGRRRQFVPVIGERPQRRSAVGRGRDNGVAAAIGGSRPRSEEAAPPRQGGAPTRGLRSPAKVPINSQEFLDAGPLFLGSPSGPRLPSDLAPKFVQQTFM